MLFSSILPRLVPLAILYLTVRELTFLVTQTKNLGMILKLSFLVPTP